MFAMKQLQALADIIFAATSAEKFELETFKRPAKRQQLAAVRFKQLVINQCHKN